MRLERNPIYRSIIVPWYDSDLVCVALMAVMATVALFGGRGVAIALQRPDAAACAWLPGMLTGMAAGVLLSVAWRLLRRRRRAQR